MGKCLMLGQIMGQHRGSIVTMRKVDLYTPWNFLIIHKFLLMGKDKVVTR